MSLQIRWTPIALQSLSEAFEYTYSEFGEDRLRKFCSEIYTATRRIAAFPQSGKSEDCISNDLGIDYRSTLVIKEIKLIYTIRQETIYIEYVKNSRQDDATMLQKLTGESL